MQVLYSHTVLDSYTVLDIHTCSDSIQVNKVGTVCTRRVADSQMVICLFQNVSRKW